MSRVVTLEKATPADIKRYIEIDKKVGGKTYAAIVTESEVLEEMAKGPVYMIKEGGVSVGSVSFHLKPGGCAYLGGLEVDPVFQGRGIGRAVVEKILQEVKGAPYVELLTHPDNTAAIGLYQSLGFKITGNKDNYFGDGEPRIMLTLQQTS